MTETRGVGPLRGTTTWLESYVARDGAALNDVIESLNHMGITLLTEGADKTAPSLVVFDVPSAELADAVRARSRHRRVLALALSRDGISRPWDLLALGASDVLAWCDGQVLPGL